MCVMAGSPAGGRVLKPLLDLELGLRVLSFDLWRAAADLADELGAPRRSLPGSGALLPLSGGGAARSADRGLFGDRPPDR